MGTLENHGQVNEEGDKKERHEEKRDEEGDEKEEVNDERSAHAGALQCCPVTRRVYVRNRMLDLGSGVIMETWQRPRASICPSTYEQCLFFWRAVSTLENEYAIM